MAVTGVYGRSQTSTIEDTYLNDLRHTTSLPYSTIASFIIGTIGIIANGFVLIVLIGFSKITYSPGIILLIHQTLTDTLSSVLILLTIGIPLAELGFLSSVRGEILCRTILSESLFWICFTASSYSLVSITLERYLAIAHPVFHRNHFSNRLVAILIVVDWFLATLAFVPLTMIFSVNDGICVPNWPSRSLDLAYGTTLSSATVFLPCIILVLGYGRMIWVLRKRSKVANSFAPGTTRNQGMSKSQQNITMTMIFLAIVYVICLMPYQVYTLTTIITEKHVENFSSNTYSFLLIWSLMNCCINPFIYAIKYETFKKGIRRMLKLKASKHVTSTDTMESRLANK